MKRIIVILFLLLFFTNTILSQESEKPVKKRESRNSWIMLRLTAVQSHHAIFTVLKKREKGLRGATVWEYHLVRGYPEVV